MLYLLKFMAFGFTSVTMQFTVASNERRWVTGNMFNEL